jgi:hypothetical protein
MNKRSDVTTSAGRRGGGAAQPNTLLDFWLLTVYAVSVLTTYRAVCFY